MADRKQWELDGLEWGLTGMQNRWLEGEFYHRLVSTTVGPERHDPDIADVAARHAPVASGKGMLGTPVAPVAVAQPKGARTG